MHRFTANLKHSLEIRQPVFLFVPRSRRVSSFSHLFVTAGQQITARIFEYSNTDNTSSCRVCMSNCRMIMMMISCPMALWSPSAARPKRGMRREEVSTRSAAHLIISMRSTGYCYVRWRLNLQWSIVKNMGLTNKKSACSAEDSYVKKFIYINTF